MSYLQFACGTKAPLVNLGVLILPNASSDWAERAPSFGAMNGAYANVRVTQGNRANAKVSSRVLHCRALHRNSSVINAWHKCSNASSTWSCDRAACDDCLKAKADNIPSDFHSPVVKKPGDLVSFDVYNMGVPHIHGGQRKVMGFHDHMSKFNYVVLLANETEEEILRGLKEFINYTRSCRVVVRHIHTDNAKPHLGPNVTAYIRDDVKARYTTIVPNTPRQNGAMERQWRNMGNDTRTLIGHAKMTRNYVWYALHESVQVANTLPNPDDNTKCPYSLFTGRRPNVTQFRVWGCMVYAKIFNPLPKVADRAVRCLHLGRLPSQPGYMCYDPETKQLHKSIHCRFVETECPGLTMSREGLEQCMPSYHDMASEDWERAPDSSVLDDTELSMLSEDAPPIYVPEDESPVPAQPAPVQAPPVPNAPRPRMGTANYNKPVPGSMAIAALACLARLTACVQPGGEAFGTQILSVDANASGSYIMYLCSGTPHAEDVQHHVQQLSAAQTYVINVDTEIGGHSHDMRTDAVTDRLKVLAADPRCLGVLATLPCSPWSAARYNPGGARPLFSRQFPNGILDPDGRVPLQVVHAKAVVHNAITIAETAMQHGARVIFESPVGRGLGSQFAIAAREDHSPLWDMELMRAFSKRHGMQVVVFDQCRLGAATAKTTQLLCSPNVHRAVQSRLGHLMCNHSQGTHERVVLPAKRTVLPPVGVFKTKGLERFPSKLNRSIAEAFLDAPHATAPWLQRVGTAIEPFTNAIVSAVSYAAMDMHALAVDMDDPAALLRGLQLMALELDHSDEAMHILNQVAPIAAALCAQDDAVCAGGPDAHVASWPVLLAFPPVAGVAKPKHGPDNPTFKQAMSGPERAEWMSALDVEINNFANRDIFEEVPEDSLPTWDPAKKRAVEVTDMMWALVKKYNEMRQLLKYKARGLVRGDLTAAVDSKLGLPPQDTFAPTSRHSTCKMVMAGACVRAHERKVQGKAINKIRVRTADAEAAFLQGKQPEQARPLYVRPPPGYRKFDRRGVPIVWRITGNIYGTKNAPRVWYETLLPQLIGSKLNFTQSEVDPCYLYKIYPDGTRIDITVYVDDILAIDDAGPFADADFAILSAMFKFNIEDEAKHFLNLNVKVLSETSIQLTMEAYLLKMADDTVPDWRSWPMLDVPGTEMLQKDYDAAHALRQSGQSSTAAQVASFRTKVGKLMYTMQGVRADAAYCISRLSRAQTFATPALEKHADRAIVYLAQTASVGVIYDGAATDAGILSAESDSDWAVGHSTTGWLIFFAGAMVAFASKRQACIAGSSTEAEIIAASACAHEVVYFKTLAKEMGMPQGVVQLSVDNSGAVELSRDRKSCHRSRNVDRRYFKVRELSYEGVLTVEHIDTADNTADILTKALSQVPHLKHLRRMFNVQVD